MKDRNFQFPNFLQKLPMLDAYQPGEDGAAGAGSLVAGPFDVTDLQLISSSATHPGSIFGYTELHLDSANDGGTTPIKSQDDPERVMFLGGLPPLGADWSMTVVLTRGSFTDSLQMQRVAGNFASMRSRVPASTIVHEEADVYYTVNVGIGRYETYVNVNLAAEVALLIHTSADTFDMFGVSLLGRSNS